MKREGGKKGKGKKKGSFGAKGQNIDQKIGVEQGAPLSWGGGKKL